MVRNPSLAASSVAPGGLRPPCPCGTRRTSDRGKLEYLRLWLKYVIEDKRTSLPPNFTSGLQLVNLQREIRDGFLTLIVPMLKQRTDLQYIVHTRGSPGEPGKHDLRIKILNLRKGSGSGSGSASAPSSAQPSPQGPAPGRRPSFSSATPPSTSTSASASASTGTGFDSAKFTSPGRVPPSPPAPSATPTAGQQDARGSPGAGGAWSADRASGGSSESVTPERKSRRGKGDLASRIEERLAMLQKQGGGPK
jgi:hypothetical protein